MSHGNSRRFSVTEITERIRSTLENEFTGVSVEGEISNFRPSSTGHYYFTLKDQNAVISAVMFKNRITRLTFSLQDGMLVIAEGNISVYAKRGNYQLICESIIEAGIGDILKLLEERKKRLAAEGLFDSDRKKKLPLFPAKIAVITSPTGAAIRDILHVLKRRNAGVHMVILPTPVQGEEAASVIAKQMWRVNKFDLGEVIILARGGGSLEDLLPFSDERVVRAIAASQIPVISAVGHEVDIVLADYAADLRAPTPSAAAEIVSESKVILLQRIQDLDRGITDTISTKIDRIKLLIQQFTPQNLERNFRILLQPMLLRLDDAKESLLNELQSKVKDFRHNVTLIKNELKSYSHVNVLKRGFSIVRNVKDNKLLRSAGQTDVDEQVHVQFEKSGLYARVEELQEEPREVTKDEKI